ncbi:MAG: septum formation inhibitor Maf [Rhizobiales bacterium]|nr:septum formation inhibitor Maf [Hyphomicrobiales bacterium]
MLWLAAAPLVLASRSKVRRALLEAAGIPVEISPADIDERAIAVGGPTDPADTAALLAQEKAAVIARAKPRGIVLGADQTLAFGGRQLHKPSGRGGAADQLWMLRGHTHALHSAVALMRGDELLFTHVAVARLTMRNFSEDFLARYLDAASEDALHSVGAYQLEGMGSHLFERVEGDYFTVLGLPLLPLLDFFRRDGWVAG